MRQQRPSVLLVGSRRNTLYEHLKLYRAGEVGPITYAHVPVEPCRKCQEPRPDDGTPCKFCGVYQHRLYQPPGERLTPPVTVSVIHSPKPKSVKLINPRRNRKI